MITLENARCPRCGGKYTVIGEPGYARPYDRNLSYYGECACGAADLAVRNGEVIRIRPCPPYEDTGPADYPETYEQEYYA